MSAPSRPPGSPRPLLMSDWKDAERNAAEWTRYLGFKDARVTPAGPDGGIDIVASAALGQVKAYTRGAIPAAVLQQLYGAAAGRPVQLLFFTTAKSFSAPAIAYADRVGMALYLMQLDGMIIPVGRDANRLMKAAVATHIALALPPEPAAALADYRSESGRLILHQDSERNDGEITFGRLVFRAAVLLFLMVLCIGLIVTAVNGENPDGEQYGTGDLAVVYVLSGAAAAWSGYLTVRLARLAKEWWSSIPDDPR